MKNKRTIHIHIEEYSSAGDLDQADKGLLDKAMEATSSAYAPYSSFRVGAAALLANGEIICAGNQENAAYPSGLCAERVALFYAQTRYPEVPVESLAVYARSDEFQMDDPVTPCGACRQVIAEHESRHGKKIRIIMGGNHGRVHVVDGIENLLPLMFMLEKLKKV
jgi:cytidine deaminase